MSWLYSQALVAEFSAATSSDGVRSALSSSSPTPQAFLPPDKMTAFSRPSRSGMTFATLTDDLGADLLTWFLADSRVRTYPLLGGVPESTASDQGCGEKWRASLAKYDPDSCLWKTAQLSLLADSDEFSETWPKWGMTRNGECWERMTLVPRIEESGSGSWPTPVATLWKNGKSGKGFSMNLNEAVKKWPTPRSCSAMAATLTNKGERFPNLETVMANRDSSTVGGRLNPTWVEWLMGWPQGWTDLKPLATDKFREWQRQHSLS